jgi:hypothetical protein
MASVLPRYSSSINRLVSNLSTTQKKRKIGSSSSSSSLSFSSSRSAIKKSKKDSDYDPKRSKKEKDSDSDDSPTYNPGKRRFKGGSHKPPPSSSSSEDSDNDSSDDDEKRTDTQLSIRQINKYTPTSLLSEYSDHPYLKGIFLWIRSSKKKKKGKNKHDLLYQPKDDMDEETNIDSSTSSSSSSRSFSEFLSSTISSTVSSSTSTSSSTSASSSSSSSASSSSSSSTAIDTPNNIIKSWIAARFQSTHNHIRNRIKLFDEFATLDTFDTYDSTKSTYVRNRTTQKKVIIRLQEKANKAQIACEIEQRALSIRKHLMMAMLDQFTPVREICRLITSYCVGFVMMTIPIDDNSEVIHVYPFAGRSFNANEESSFRWYESEHLLTDGEENKVIIDAEEERLQLDASRVTIQQNNSSLILYGNHGTVLNKNDASNRIQNASDKRWYHPPNHTLNGIAIDCLITNLEKNPLLMIYGPQPLLPTSIVHGEYRLNDETSELYKFRYAVLWFDSMTLDLHEPRPLRLTKFHRCERVVCKEGYGCGQVETCEYCQTPVLPRVRFSELQRSCLRLYPYTRDDSPFIVYICSNCLERVNVCPQDFEIGYHTMWHVDADI